VTTNIKKLRDQEDTKVDKRSDIRKTMKKDE